jgi:hypothetical protein
MLWLPRIALRLDLLGAGGRGEHLLVADLPEEPFDDVSRHGLIVLP